MLVAQRRLELTLTVEELVANCERLPVMRFLPVSAPGCADGTPAGARDVGVNARQRTRLAVPLSLSVRP